MPHDRTRFAPKTFSRSIRPGEAIDLGGFGMIEFYGNLVKITVSSSVEVKFLPPDDVASNVLPLSASA